MQASEIRQLLYEKYIEPTAQPRQNYVGVEVEMPVVNLNEGPSSFELAQSAANALIEEYGFVPDKHDENGVCFSATRPDNGDNISFDCSYNNLELSLGRELSICALSERFNSYVSFLNRRLNAGGHTLTGFGINPRAALNRTDFIPSERYRMLERYLKKGEEWSEPMYFHPYTAYGSFASASQVQLDVHRDRLVPTLRAFSMVEPVKAVLFSNSWLPQEPQLLCVRDMLWENSPHGLNPHNIGMFDCRLESVDDLLEYISTTSIFCTERDGRYINFKPVPIIDYLALPQVTGEYYEAGSYRSVTFEPSREDLAYLRTYKFEDLTYRGTIEFRSCCCQPFGSAMSVAAFHAGLMDRVPQLDELLLADRVLYHHGYSATELRRLFNRRSWPTFVDREALRTLCVEVLELARSGLQERGLGEERFLDPLFERAESLCSPARALVEGLEQGRPIEAFIEEYAALS
ncbi:MAG: hypothetical protein ACI36Y_01975 [Coriobacteriales bacterium]